MKKLCFLFVSICIIFKDVAAQSGDGVLPNISPGSVGYDSKKLQNICKQASDSIPSLGSILVWKQNGLICQEYFHDADATTIFDVKSLTKSITSAITGVIYDRGLLPDLRTSVLDILPEYDLKISGHKNIWYPDIIRDNDSIRKLLTLKNLLSMQTGLLWDDNNPLIHRAFQCSSDPVRFVLELPFEARPGTLFRYCTGGCQVLSAILEKSTKNKLYLFADSLLFKPVGMNIYNWPSDAMGRPAGGATICTDPISLMRFGLLYLNEGNSNGKQVISKQWVRESTSAVTELNDWDVLPNANGYGYYWWRRKVNNHQAFVASGYGGQLICIIPDLETVVVTTCFVNDKNRGRAEIKALHKIIDEIISAKLK